MYIKLRTNNHPTTWLLDSGASVSLVKLSLIKRLSLPVSHKNTVFLTDISGNKLENHGEAHITFDLGNKAISHSIVICGEELKYEADGLIGLDFLDEFKPRIDFGKKRFWICGLELPLQGDSSVPHGAVGNNPSSQAGKPGRHIRMNLENNRPDDSDDYPENRHENLPSAAEPRDSAGFKVREGSKNSLKHPNLLSTREDIEIPGFHGCDCRIPVNTRVPAGTVICEPFPHLNPNICIARSIATVPQPTTDQSVRTIVIRILNINPTPLIIKRHTPILTVTSVREPDVEGSSSAGHCGSRDAHQVDRVGLKFFLQPQVRAKLDSVLRDCPEIFRTFGRPTMARSLVKHRIYTGDAPPIAKSPYRVQFVRKRAMHDRIERMLEDSKTQRFVMLSNLVEAICMLFCMKFS
ncbi:hypothetical protein Zmor_005681 [Zophobas morio]|uniref:Peptidase A2 domain-containing protein n=1 Tax=Zophobas morio TaxID=2755281 RepID=A0AA38IUV2_9CUCU|nr:hypothetical protein Zmor_005681 [Zophobas morio]